MPRPRPFLVLSACVALLGASACSSTKTTPLSGAGGTGSTVLPVTCTAPGYHVATDATRLDEVQASLSDPSGAPVPQLLVQVCGLNLCINGTTNAAGKTDVALGSQLLERPAFKYGDGFLFGKIAALLGPAAKQDLGPLIAVPLADYSQGAPFPSSGAVTQGDITLTLAAGTQINHDLLTYTDDSELVLRSAPIPLEKSAAAADPSLGFELAYTLAPVSTTFCPAAALSVKNTLGWAAATAVDVFIQGLEVDEKWAPYGGWVKVADASVSADGSVITTTSGGIPILSSIALRRR